MSPGQRRWRESYPTGDVAAKGNEDADYELLVNWWERSAAKENREEGFLLAKTIRRGRGLPAVEMTVRWEGKPETRRQKLEI